MTEVTSNNELDAALAPFREMAMFEGYDISLPESAGMDGDTPLHVAAMDEGTHLLEALLEFARDIDIPGDIGNTPLHYAVLFGRADNTRILLEHGADMERENEYGDTPMSLMLSHSELAPLVQRYGRGRML